MQMKSSAFCCALVFALASAVLTGDVLGQSSSPTGPSGGTGGQYFEDTVFATTSGPGEVVEVRVRSGQYIDAVQVVVLVNGLEQELPIHGGGGGYPQAFRLNPGEYIQAMGGRYGQYVDSLFIRTSMGRSQQWGGGGGAAQYFYGALSGTRIRGFIGRAGQYVDAIGAMISTDQ
jgi:hypothetical protein